MKRLRVLKENPSQSTSASVDVKIYFRAFVTPKVRREVIGKLMEAIGRGDG